MIDADTVWAFLLLAAAILPLSAAETANLTIAATFGDNMVLQRDKSVPVWGRSKTDQKVTVAFAGQTKECVPDDTGKWMLKLDAMTEFMFLAPSLTWRR